MAKTKIWPVRDNLARVVEYAENHLKTANPEVYTAQELADLREVLDYVREYEWLFLRQINEKSTEEQAKTIAEKWKKIMQYDKRIFELDSLFQRLYEDSVAGKITDERFLKMSAAYESEQAELKKEYAKL